VTPEIRPSFVARNRNAAIEEIFWRAHRKYRGPLDGTKSNLPFNISDCEYTVSLGKFQFADVDPAVPEVGFVVSFHTNSNGKEEHSFGHNGLGVVLDYRCVIGDQCADRPNR